MPLYIKRGFMDKCDNCGKKQDNVDVDCGMCTFCGTDQTDKN